MQFVNNNIHFFVYMRPYPHRPFYPYPQKVLKVNSGPVGRMGPWGLKCPQGPGAHGPIGSLSDFKALGPIGSLSAFKDRGPSALSALKDIYIYIYDIYIYIIFIFI